MYFEIISEIKNIEIIAIGNKIKDVNRLIKYYGNGRWRKMKGIADIMFQNNILKAELH